MVSSKPLTVTFTPKRLIGIWSGMIQRCHNSKNKAYNNYGGRGITVCVKWKKSYEVFAIWAILNGYKDSLSIERVNNNGSYNPRNCNWVTGKQQANNKRSNVRIRVGNQIRTISQWSELTGVPRQTIGQRYKKGLRNLDLFKEFGASGLRHITYIGRNYRVRITKDRATVFDKTFSNLEIAITERDNFKESL